MDRPVRIDDPVVIPQELTKQLLVRVFAAGEESVRVHAYRCDDPTAPPLVLSLHRPERQCARSGGTTGGTHFAAVVTAELILKG